MDINFCNRNFDIWRYPNELQIIPRYNLFQKYVSSSRTAFPEKPKRIESVVFQYSGQMPREVTVIRSMAPINLIVYYPKTEEGQIELAKRVSDVHATAVTQRIKSLNCPTSQKLELLDAVIETVKERSREQT